MMQEEMQSAQRRKTMSASVGEKLVMMDQLRANAVFLKSLRPKEK